MIWYRLIGQLIERSWHRGGRLQGSDTAAIPDVQALASFRADLIEPMMIAARGNRIGGLSALTGVMITQAPPARDISATAVPSSARPTANPIGPTIVDDFEKSYVRYIRGLKAADIQAPERFYHGRSQHPKLHNRHDLRWLVVNRWPSVASDMIFKSDLIAAITVPNGSDGRNTAHHPLEHELAEHDPWPAKLRAALLGAKR